MAVPIVQSFTANNGGAAQVSNLDITQPSGLSNGDLCILIACSENTNTDDWNALTGWNKRVGSNSSSADADLAVYSRIIDGTESWPINLTAGSNDFRVCWAIRVSGVHASDYWHVTGTPQNSTGSSIGITSVTTTASDCLAFYATCFDGEDGVPQSVSGTGWSESDEDWDHDGGTTGLGTSGSWGTKSMPASGTTGTATVSFNSSDGNTSVQFAIRGSTVTPPVITSVGGGGTINDQQTSIAIVGTDLPDGTGSSKYEIGSTATYASATKVQVEVNSYTSSLASNIDAHEISTLNPIDDDITLSPQGTTVYLYATDSASNVSAGFAFTLYDKGADWLAASNTGITVDVSGGNEARRVAVAIEVDSGTLSSGSILQAQYNKNAAGWNDITNGSSVLQANPIAGFADGDDVPDLGLGSGTYVLNNDAAEEATGTITLGSDIPAGSRFIAELSFLVIAADVSDTDTVQIRWVKTGPIAFDSYTNTPSITIQKGTVNPARLALLGVGV